MSIERYNAVDLIHIKRDKGTLTTDHINWLIDAYTRGHVADEQMAAMAMAIYLNGMNSTEIANLTNAIIDSGERMNFTKLGKPTTDKHSTGGVGDKITLPLMPLVVSFGAAVPQLSGRGLGHTGGTLDKLESIPGWKANLTNDEIFHNLQTVGGVVCAAGKELAPADGKLYALRDITGTVDSIPLIAASIMSKKIAEGTSSLVLDVKYGSGAFLTDINRSRQLAETMVQLGKDAGVNTVALLTDMNIPLGYTIGNAIEVQESLDILAGGGPEDVKELTIALATEMLTLAGITDIDVAENLNNGKAMDAWNATIRAQGGNPTAPLPTAPINETIYATTSGTLIEQQALPYGIGAWQLGAGRNRKEDPVDHTAGITLHKKPGDTVTAGDPLYTLHTSDPERLERVQNIIKDAYRISDTETYTPRTTLIADRIA